MYPNAVVSLSLSFAIVRKANAFGTTSLRTAAVIYFFVNSFRFSARSLSCSLIETEDRHGAKEIRQKIVFYNILKFIDKVEGFIMLKKSKLKKEINASRKKIQMLEQKRTRSQAALVYALLNHTTPNDSDIEYFNKFTVEMENERARMHELMAELDNMS